MLVLILQRVLIPFPGSLSIINHRIKVEQKVRGSVAEQEVVWVLRTTLLLGPPIW